MNRILFIIFLLLSAVSLSGHPAASQQSKKGWFYGPVKVGNLPIAYVELSGLATAQRQENKNYIWAIEDGANPHIIAINRATAANAGKWVLTGASVSDVEECGSVRRGGIAYVYLLDTGDNANARATFKVFRVKEPVVTGSDGTLASGTDWEEIVCAFPGGNIPTHKDVEAAIVDPLTGDLFIITKRITPTLCYKLSWAASYTGTQTLTYMGALSADATFNTLSTTPSGNDGYATGGCISPNGTEILVRSYDKVSRFSRNPSTQTVYDALATTPTQMPCATGTKASGFKAVQTNAEPQGEAICFDSSGLYYYTCSEYVTTHGGTSTNYPLFRFDRSLGAPTTYSFQQGVSSYTGNVDTYLDSSLPTTANGTSTTLVVDWDYSAYPTVSRTRQAFIQFDLSSIPTDQIVIQAYLEILIGTEGLGFVMHKILIPWVATDTWDTLVNGISANNVDAVSTPETIYGPTPVGQGLDNYTGFCTINLNVATVQGWVTTPSSNNGWLLQGPDESSGDGLQFNSANNLVASIRPRLVIVTAPPIVAP